MKLILALMTALTVALPAAASDVPVGDDGLHKPAWFHETFKDLGEDFADASAEGKLLLLIVEQRGCLQQDLLALPRCEQGVDPDDRHVAGRRRRTRTGRGTRRAHRGRGGCRDPDGQERMGVGLASRRGLVGTSFLTTIPAHRHGGGPTPAPVAARRHHRRGIVTAPSDKLRSLNQLAGECERML